MHHLQTWQPPDFDDAKTKLLAEIKKIFSDIYPQTEFGSLSDRIYTYWTEKLKHIWRQKPAPLKAKDLKYVPENPLERIDRNAVVITYADSVYEKGRLNLEVLDRFLSKYFPAVQGLHILPACEIDEQRFNDGGFSQIQRNRIHMPHGTNAQFEDLMARYFSMTDFVLNHVDIEHPLFKAYLNGDDDAGKCFFVFNETEYQHHVDQGDFDLVFRPRPFPLFTIFRRKPKGQFANSCWTEKCEALKTIFSQKGLTSLPDPIVEILVIFGKVKNDQMLLDSDYDVVRRFFDYLTRQLKINPDDFLVVSTTQETRHTPYIFKDSIQSPLDLLNKILPILSLSPKLSQSYFQILAQNDTIIFGEPIRALTTFSHVQVDLNTTTFEGLKLLIDDFAWYLSMDLNMLRLDAANFAFKKWKTSCFGLPQVTRLLKVLYLSMDCVAPRMIPNLEVNAPLSAVLSQMADKTAPPPMMYDFHLASMLPVVMNEENGRPLCKIPKVVGQFDIPHNSIRFSLDESHDGKSVNGSGGADPLLTYAQRQALVETVLKNKGHVKYKSCPKRQYPMPEFLKVCKESGLDAGKAGMALFENAAPEAGLLQLKAHIKSSSDIADALNLSKEKMEADPALSFFLAKILDGREPYELCITTRDSLKQIKDPVMEVKRYMALKTLAVALMGRHVKAVYINDLMGLKNDHQRVAQTGELRNIKRTKSEYRKISGLLGSPANIEHWIAGFMNNLIALADADPALAPQGREAQVFVHDRHPQIVFIVNGCHSSKTLIIINLSPVSQIMDLQWVDVQIRDASNWVDNFTGNPFKRYQQDDGSKLSLGPFGRLWLSPEKISIDQDFLVKTGSHEDMRTALSSFES